MDWQQIQVHWPALVQRVVMRWPEADADEVLATNGQPDALVDYLTRVTGRDRTVIRDEVSTWTEGELPLDVRMDEDNDNRAIMDAARHIPPDEDVYADDQAFGDEEKPDQPMGRDRDRQG